MINRLGVALIACLFGLPAAKVAAATLLKGELPTAEKVKRLSPLFSPRPGQGITLSSDEVRDFHRRVAPDKLRGVITVSPPKGYCLRITRADDEVDDVICKKTGLSFRFTDLDRTGRLTWQIKTGDGDFGTELQWPSPYRIGSVIPFGIDALKDPPEHVYISTCKAESGPTGRRIRLGLLSGEKWIIHFPEADALAPQPEDASNLDVDFMSNGKRGVKEASGDKEEGKKESEAKKESEGDKKDGDKKEAEKTEGGGDKPAPKVKDATEIARDDRLIWAVPARNAYMMPSDRFQPNGSVTRGIHGQCRYIYTGPPEDPTTGRLECHEVDGFQQVYLPLTCLHEIQREPTAKD